MKTQNNLCQIGVITSKKQTRRISFTPQELSNHLPQFHSMEFEKSKEGDSRDSSNHEDDDSNSSTDDSKFQNTKISKSPTLTSSNRFEQFENNFSVLIESFKKKRNSGSWSGDQNLENFAKIADIKKPTKEKNSKNIAEQLAEEAGSLTNTIEISNFYEYTQSCMKIIADIKREGAHYIKPKKVVINAENKNKKLAVFDLDETLVHCVIKNFSGCKNIIQVKMPSGKVAKVGVNIRPGWEEVIKELQSLYTIVIYTASHNYYADSVLNFLDPGNKYFQNRLYRSNCIELKYNDNTIYIKDMTIFEGYSLKDVVIIDNSVLSFAFHLDNGIPIVPYYDAETDTELKFCALYLKSIADCEDIRERNQKFIKIESYLKQAYEEDEDEESENGDPTESEPTEERKQIGKSLHDSKKGADFSNVLKNDFENLRNQFSKEG